MDTEEVSSVPLQKLYDEIHAAKFSAFRGIGDAEREAYISELRAEVVSKFPEWPENIQHAVMNGLLMEGMSRDQVLAVLGTPDEIRSSESRFGTREQWIYKKWKPTGLRTAFTVFLKNGKFSSVKEL